MRCGGDPLTPSRPCPLMVFAPPTGAGLVQAGHGGWRKDSWPGRAGWLVALESRKEGGALPAGGGSWAGQDRGRFVVCTSGRPPFGGSLPLSGDPVGNALRVAGGGPTLPDALSTGSRSEEAIPGRGAANR